MLRVLFVCTGNICRSPLAQAFLADRSRKLLGGLVDVASAGTWGRGGAVDDDTLEAARELGLDLDGHRPRPVTEDLVARAHLVLGLTSEHRDRVIDLVPEAAERTFTLKELAALVGTLPAPAAAGTPVDRARARIEDAHRLRTGPAAPPVSDQDVSDPIGQSFQVHRAVAWDIRRAVDQVVAGLFGVSEAVEGAPATSRTSAGSEASPAPASES